MADRLPDLTRVNGFDYRESDLILDPKFPNLSARRLLRDRYTIDAGQVLHHHRGAFYGWTGRHYVEITDQYLKSDIYHFVEYAKRQGDKDRLVPFEPNRSRVGEIEAALRAVTYLGDTLQPPVWLDETPDLPPAEIIACTNGLLHLPTLSLIPHSPAFFTHNAIDYEYDATAKEPTAWLSFLNDLWPNDPASIETLQEIFGYCLVADTSQQKAFMLIGPKRSGKGTIARILEDVIGTHNVVAPTLTGLGTNFGMAPLIGKRLAIISDARISNKADTAVIAEHILSVTGEDIITIDRKNRDAWTGKLDIRFLLISNELPRLVDASGALPSRFIMLILNNSFFGREDRSLIVRLRKERSAILNWSIEGYAKLSRRGYFQQPDSAADAIRILEDIGSPIRAFVRDCCVIEAGRISLASDLYDAWATWCGDQGRGIVSTLQTFGRDLHAAVPSLKTTQPREFNRARCYEGIALVR